MLLLPFFLFVLMVCLLLTLDVRISSSPLLPLRTGTLIAYSDMMDNIQRFKETEFFGQGVALTVLI